MIRLSRNGFALHIHVGAPATRLTEGLFEIGADRWLHSPITYFFTVGSGKDDIAAQEICILFFNISEIGNDAFSRFRYFIILVPEPFDLSAHACPIIVMANIFSKQSVIISQA